ncbi:unnamed protein product [Mytilus coruscus]|uniref:Peptidase aspartic putative domain-containing protein n=1 Tax=Mytilus coruscus TaxID=42192 RepID=A0A6J8B4T6_MYTCO|nr:unnamed protein product [Mytilus coruscus]
MDSKLESVCAGHKGAATKLLLTFDDLKSNTNTEVDEVKALDDAVTQTQKTLIDLNSRLLDQKSEENLEQEITNSDEYMYELDCKLRQIRKFTKPLEKSEHFPTECTEITDVNTRSQIVKQKHLCFNCLGSHRVAACNFIKQCKTCNGMHHSSICKGKDVIRGTTQQPTIQQLSINVIETTDESSVLHSSQQSRDILLKTSITPVIYIDQGVESNILFDEGAQRSFKIQKLVDQLEMKPTRKVSIHPTAFGDLSQNVRNLDTATIRQTDTGEKIRINTLINTAIGYKNGKYTAKLSWKHDHPDLPSNMAVARSRTENISQCLVQSRTHVNSLDEKLQGSKLESRPPVRAHQQLVESRSHIDTGQELVTCKDDYCFVCARKNIHKWTKR